MDKVILDYQRLLRAGESIRSLDSTFSLVERIAGREGAGRTDKWVKIVADENTGPIHAGPAPARRLRRIEWVLGQLPSIAKRKGLPLAQYSMLFDVLLLVFHHAFFLWSRSSERSCSLCAGHLQNPSPLLQIPSRFLG